MKSALFVSSRTWKTRGLTDKGAKNYYDGVAYQLRVAVKHWRQHYEAASVDTEHEEGASVEASVEDEDSDSTLTLGEQHQDSVGPCIKSSGHASWMLQDLVKMGIAVDADIYAEDEEACNVLVPDR